jgi:hypothetical protein
MKKSETSQTLSFYSKLERIASGMEYYALSVPANITKALGTKGPVPVLAAVNRSTPFRVSLFPVGEGRHYLRVKAQVRTEAKIKGGDRVHVQITVRDREAENTLPKDLEKALKSKGALSAFRAFPPGKKGFMLRKIEEAVRPETREKRIQDLVKAATRHLK